MNQELTYNHRNVSSYDILRRITNVRCKSMMMMLSLIVIVMIGQIDHEKLGKAQSDIMSPIIMHIHPQLSLLVNGTSVTVPAQIGIVPSLWKGHSLDKFGMQSMAEMNMSAMAPLHTHDNSGIIHVESTVNRNYTLGEFLNIWGLNLDGMVVKMTTNGKPLTDFKNHILRDGEQIKLEVQ
jgi:sulfur carrier protein ThiS